MATKPSPLNTFANIQTPAPTPAPQPAEESLPTGEKLRQKVFRLTAAQNKRLNQYCADSDNTIQDVVIEGINLVLKSKGLPPI